MHIGVTIRVMGEQSTPALLLHCARAAEQAGLDSLWIVDHIAIPPDDAEGSGGRYLDAPTTLSWLAAHTSRIRIGTSVLVLPYRPALPTAKWAATLQELSGNRLMLGLGIGWMPAEFRAVGVPLRDRVKHSHATLRFLHECFANDEAVSNGQRFLFRPRPPRPPIYIGGAAPHALHRAVRYGDGWMPMTNDPTKLRASIEQYHALSDTAGKPRGAVVSLGGLPIHDAAKTREQLAALAALDVDTVICALRYSSADEFSASLTRLQLAASAHLVTVASTTS